MAVERNLAESDRLFVGEDKQLSFTVFEADGSTPQDISGWALSWQVKKHASSMDPAILTKTTGNSGISITGTFDADPDVNTQRAVVTLTDDDTALLHTPPYRYELKRTDASNETVLVFGALRTRPAVHAS